MLNTCVIASYKYGHLAAQAIESVLNQTKKFDHVILVDDGVGDCAHLPDIYPEVKYVLRPENIGVIENFNDILFNHVKTDRVMYLGADNWLDHMTLEIVSRQDADIVSYAAWLVQSGVPDRWRVDVPHGSSLYNVEKARAVGGYASSGNAHHEEDSVLFRKMRDNGATFVNLEDTLLMYRWRHRLNYNK